MTRTLINWAVDILLIGWTGLMIAVAIMAVWFLVDITRDRARGDHRRRRGRADIKERPPRARVGAGAGVQSAWRAGRDVRWKRRRRETERARIAIIRRLGKADDIR